MLKLERVSTVVLALFALSGCSTTQTAFYKNPTGADSTSLCRAAFETQDPRFQQDAVDELMRRGLTAEDCEKKVTSQNIGIAAVAIIAGATTLAAVCSSNDCSGIGGGGGYVGSAGSDVDCLGGSGNGPRFIQGPVRVGNNDPFDLDRDNDGIGCEAGDFGA